MTAEEQNELSVYVAEWRVLAQVAALMSEALPIYHTAHVAVGAMKRRPITRFERETYAQVYDALVSSLNGLIAGARRLDEIQAMPPDDLNGQIARFVSKMSKMRAEFGKELSRAKVKA
jgi:hypothetical protein